MGFGVDITSVSVGIRHSIMTHVKKQYNAYSFMECSCHLVYSIAGHASKAFQESCGFDMEDLCVNG